MVFGLGEDAVGQPAHQGLLVEARLRLQQFHTVQQSAKLVLPSASCGEELFQHQGAPAYLALVPSQSAKLAERPEHGGGQHAAGAQSGAGGDG